MDLVNTPRVGASAELAEDRRVRARCCPFCLTETLSTSWDEHRRCVRYQCAGCFEVFFRMTPAQPRQRARGDVVEFRVARAHGGADQGR